ncbi:MAG: tubulin-like doman-containing protein, partial [Snowella sp.]
MQKTLIIGIGGTGLTTIREIRRLIAERYEQGLRAPEVASTKFLYIDTDEGDVKSHTWSVLGESIELADGEKIIINGNDLKPYIDTPDHYPDISPWLPRISDYIGEPGDGAKGIRPYGRLIYEYTENKQAIKQKIVDCYTTLNESFRQITDWRFYLVCGLSGGTGSGMFLPLSFNLLDWDIYQRGQSNRKF